MLNDDRVLRSERLLRPKSRPEHLASQR